MTAREIADIFERIQLRLIASLKRNLARHKAEEKKYGFSWGGEWRSSKDYQHFYKEYDSPLKMAVNKLKRALLR